MVPLMLAVSGMNGYMIKYLMAKEAPRDVVDKKNNSIYHYAAITNREIIEVTLIIDLFICNDSPNMVNLRHVK